MLPKYANQALAIMFATLMTSLLMLATSSNPTPHSFELASETIRVLICIIAMFYIERTKSHTQIYIPLLLGLVSLFYGSLLNMLDDIQQINHTTVDLTEDILITIGFILAIIGIINWTSHYQYQVKLLAKQSIHHQLTQVLNRKGCLAALYCLNLDHSKPLGILILSVDHFKQLNRSYGFEKIELLLQQLCNLIQQHCSDDFQIGHWSDDEFIIFGHTEDQHTIDALAGSLTDTIATQMFIIEGNVIPITLTIGISATQHLNIIDSVKAAEQHLFENQQTKLQPPV